VLRKGIKDITEAAACLREWVAYADAQLPGFASEFEGVSEHRERWERDLLAASQQEGSKAMLRLREDILLTVVANMDSKQRRPCPTDKP
jgi:hypothetical protein